jgi:hypothetical protein
MKPDWRSPAWEKLNGYIVMAQNPLIPVSPKDSKESVQLDLFMIDQLGVQHVTDPETGAEIRI